MEGFFFLQPILRKYVFCNIMKALFNPIKESQHSGTCVWLGKANLLGEMDFQLGRKHQGLASQQLIDTSILAPVAQEFPMNTRFSQVL